jgi:hypothetical protein
MSTAVATTSSSSRRFAEHVPASALDRIVGLVERAADGLGDGEPP